MILTKLHLEHFRNIESASLELSQSFNFVVGQNGSGKSSLLEAIHLFGFGRSFRTNKVSSCIKHGQDSLTLFAKVADQFENKEPVNFGYRRDVDGHVTMKVNGDAVDRLSEFARGLAVQLYSPQSSDVLTGAPVNRRKFLDWGLFHVKQSFGIVSSQYAKSLQHRNALLKNNAVDATQLSYWDDQLSTLGEQIAAERERYVSDFKRVLLDNLPLFLPEYEFDVSHARGWSRDTSLLDALRHNLQRDQRFGHTNCGPHKADLKIKVSGKPINEVLSRGQLRMAMAACQLSQSTLLFDSAGKQCVFMIDDLGAELDKEKQRILIDALAERNAQIFVTAIEKENLSFLTELGKSKMFHVKQGHVTEENV